MMIVKGKIFPNNLTNAQAPPETIRTVRSARIFGSTTLEPLVESHVHFFLDQGADQEEVVHALAAALITEAVNILISFKHVTEMTEDMNPDDLNDLKERALGYARDYLEQYTMAVDVDTLRVVYADVDNPDAPAPPSTETVN